MSKNTENTATKNTEPLPKETKAAVHVEADPNQKVTLDVFDQKNAGRTVNSRFGPVAFDGTGQGNLTVTLRDVELIHQLGWLSTPDKEKYLGVVPPEDPEVVKVHRLHKEQMTKAEQYFDGLREELSSLRQENAELIDANAALSKRVHELTDENAALQEALTREQQRVVTTPAPVAPTSASVAPTSASVAPVGGKPEGAKGSR